MTPLVGAAGHLEECIGSISSLRNKLLESINVTPHSVRNHKECSTDPCPKVNVNSIDFFVE